MVGTRPLLGVPFGTHRRKVVASGDLLGQRPGAGRPPGGLRKQVPGEFGECLNAEVLLRTGKCVSLEKGTALGSGWLLGGGGEPNRTGESKLQEMKLVSGFLFLLK